MLILKEYKKWQIDRDYKACKPNKIKMSNLGLRNANLRI